MKNFKKSNYANTLNNYMELEGYKRNEWYSEQGGRGPYIIRYEPVREAMIRVETADGKQYDYSDKDPYKVRCVHKESAKLFDEEFCRKEFSEILRTLMLENDVTPRELSELTDISATRMERIWKGTITPTITDVARIATALGTYPGNLLDCM